MAVRAFVSHLAPSFDPTEELARLIERAEQFTDWPLVKAELQRVSPDLKDSALEEARLRLHKSWTEAGGLTLAYLAIADEVERRYGSGARAEYLVEIALGNAK
jgi:hypothetical protein